MFFYTKKTPQKHQPPPRNQDLNSQLINNESYMLQQQVQNLKEEIEILRQNKETMNNSNNNENIRDMMVEIINATNQSNREALYMQQEYFMKMMNKEEVNYGNGYLDKGSQKTG